MDEGQLRAVPSSANTRREYNTIILQVIKELLDLDPCP
jgi:hypothetical protein